MIDEARTRTRARTGVAVVVVDGAGAETEAETEARLPGLSQINADVNKSLIKKMRKSANFQLAIREQQGSQPHTHTHTHVEFYSLQSLQSLDSSHGLVTEFLVPRASST